MLLFALLLLPVAIWLTGHLPAGTRTSRAQPLARLTRPTSWNPLEGRHVRLPPALPPASPRAAPVAPGGRGPPALRQLRVVVSEKEQCNCIAVCQAEPLARRSLLPGLPAPAAAGGIGDSNGDPCPDAGDRVANIIIIVVVITATTSPIIFQGSSDLLRSLWRAARHGARRGGGARQPRGSGGSHRFVAPRRHPVVQHVEQLYEHAPPRPRWHQSPEHGQAEVLPASGGWPICLHFINAVSDRHWKI